MENFLIIFDSDIFRLNISFYKITGRELLLVLLKHNINLIYEFVIRKSCPSFK